MPRFWIGASKNYVKRTICFLLYDLKNEMFHYDRGTIIVLGLPPSTPICGVRGRNPHVCQKVLRVTLPCKRYVSKEGL